MECPARPTLAAQEQRVEGGAPALVVQDDPPKNKNNSKGRVKDPILAPILFT